MFPAAKLLLCVTLSLVVAAAPSKEFSLVARSPAELNEIPAEAPTRAPNGVLEKYRRTSISDSHEPFLEPAAVVADIMDPVVCLENDSLAQRSPQNVNNIPAEAATKAPNGVLERYRRSPCSSFPDTVPDREMPIDALTDTRQFMARQDFGDLIVDKIGRMEFPPTLNSPNIAGLARANGLNTRLVKTGSMTKRDGTFHLDAGISQIAKSLGKHAQNFENLERKGLPKVYSGNIRGPTVPKKHMPPGPKGPKTHSVNNPRPTSVAHPGNKPHPSKNKRDSTFEPLDDHGEIFWTGTIAIGNQNFTVIFDTGSSDLWVPNAVGCTTCEGLRAYNSSSSTTSIQQSGNFNLTYGDGSVVSGPIFTDNVVVAGVEVKNQTFSAATELVGFSSDQGFDGILGMAFKSISSLDADPVIQNAENQKAITIGDFGFKLASTGSELVVNGAANSPLYTGDIENHSVIPELGFWMPQNASAFLGNGTDAVVSNFSTIIDSGTTLVIGPGDQVKDLYDSANINATMIDGGLWTYPCATPPSVSFSWDGEKHWAITPDNFNMGLVDVGSSLCVGAISSDTTTNSSQNPVWIFGDSFMKNVFTVFSVDNSTVGFAQLS
ncbi:hypothetical protein NLI96_g11413 [Meripilus lineatus]|uniref:Peptidase A1 domain-containing protein n=1 Tax=Meripilus lineatus TaxID=2056292 RepID=A0AAD5YAY7_9APHY|nr:hypothetical protein NLI96_g11413 [Physisporinus lineatus]